MGHQRSITVTGLWLGALLALAGGGCATVPPGYTGVAFGPSGLHPQPLGEGLAVTGPLTSVALYDLRLQTRAEDLAAVAADGAPLVAHTSVVGFHIPAAEAVALHQEVGPAYYDRVVRPLVRSAVRRVLAGYRSDAINAAAIAKIQRQIRDEVAPRLRPFHVIVDSLDLRNLVVDYAPSTYAVILETGRLEQLVLTRPQLLAIAAREADVRRQQASGLLALHQRVAPTLTAPTLTHSATRALGELLSAPATTVISGNSGTVLEVK